MFISNCARAHTILLRRLLHFWLWGGGSLTTPSTQALESLPSHLAHGCPQGWRRDFITLFQNDNRTNWWGRTLWQVVKGVEIREPKGDLFCFVSDLLPEALSRSWTQEQFLRVGPGWWWSGSIFETRDLSLFDLQTWALETVSGLLAGRWMALRNFS